MIFRNWHGIYTKYHVQILLFVYTTTRKRFVIFKLSRNTNALSQSDCRNFSCSSIITEIFLRVERTSRTKLLVAIFIIIILEVPRISVLMPAELTPNNFLFCSKALKFGILYQTQSLRFLHCNRLKRKFLIFYYIDNASCTVRCCVLL